jgi:hypothetical protein
LIDFEIVKEEVREMMDIRSGILFLNKKCRVDGDIYATGPIIALGDLTVEGKIGGEVCVMVGGSLSVKERIDTFFLVASNLNCEGEVLLTFPESPLKGPPSPMTPFASAYEFWKMMVKERAIFNIDVWNKMTVGSVHSGGVIKVGGNIYSVREISASKGIKCDGNIISKGNIVGEFIESKKNIISNGDIIAKKYIKADGVIKACNKIEILKKEGGIFAGLKVKNPKKPSIIAKEVIGLIKQGRWEKLA